MYSLKVNSTYLDLPQDFDLQITRTNMLYCFDTLVQDRTTSFALPTTAKNNRVFTLSNDVNTYGDAARQSYYAILESGVVQIAGRLYITDATATEYNCVFVFNELYALKQIRDAGTINNYLMANKSVYWGDAAEVYASNDDAVIASGGEWAVVQYQNNVTTYVGVGTCPLPSVRMDYLLGLCASYFGVTLRTADTEALKRYRIVIPKANVISSVGTTVWKNGDIITSGNSVTAYIDATNLNEQYFKTRWLTWQADGYTITAQCYVAQKDVTLTFPTLTNWMTDAVLINPLTKEMYGGTIVTYPSYLSGDGTVTTETQLSGRNVTIPAGATFLFAYVPDVRGEVNRWCIKEYNFSVTLQDVTSDDTYNKTIPLQYNLPEVTFMDLLRTSAHLLGRTLYYYEDESEQRNFLWLDDADVDAFAIRNVGAGANFLPLVSRGAVKRTFADFAQSNKVGFDSADYVYTPATITYDVPNVNLNATADIYTIPFNEGDKYLNGMAFLDDCTRSVDSDGVVTYEYKADDFSLLYCGDNSVAYMQQVELPAAAFLQALCEQSTQTEIQVAMSLLEFTSLTTKTKLYMYGAYYVWTAANWQKGIATLTLQKT